MTTSSPSAAPPAIVVRGALRAAGTGEAAAAVSPAEFAAVFRHYSHGNVDAPHASDPARTARLNMALRVAHTPYVDDAGVRSWWA